MHDSALRPTEWHDYVGQAALKARLEMHISAAMAENRPLEHVLLSGPPGSGKTTMAKIIAGRLSDPLLAFARLPESGEFERQLIGRPGGEWNGAGVLFIDEAHRLRDAQQEQFLTLLDEERVLDTKFGRYHFPFLTVIFATTERESIIAPLRDRFMIKPMYADYSDEEMGLIAAGMAERGSVAMNDGDAAVLGRAGGGVPRHARELVLAYRDMAVSGGELPDPEAVVAMCGRRLDGLSEEHVAYLDLLCRLDGQAGEAVLAAQLRLDRSEIREIERLLIDRNLIRRTSSGRIITPEGRGRLAEENPTMDHRASRVG